MKLRFNAIALALCILALPGLTLANSVGSSTLEFEGALSDGGGGIYTGTIPATAGSWYVVGGGGEAISTGGGFDVYAREGGCAFVAGYYGAGAFNCNGTDTYTIGYYGSAPHDAYPDDGGGSPPWGSWFNPDCADYFQYELELTADHWYLRYAPTGESPMSGQLYWASGYAAETDLGTQNGGHDGSAAHGGGAGAWDWDCGWGVEAIPLELAGFDIQVDDLGGGNYHVTLTPAEAPDVINTVESSTMVFEGSLTDLGGGVYTGTIDATAGDYYVPGGGGETVSTAGGFDVYALTGGCAFVEGYYGTGAWNCDGTDTYVIGFGDANDHDGYPDDGTGSPPWGDFWNPDVADYHNYQLVLTETAWALEFKSEHRGTPMSGAMNWQAGYASEDDIGSYTGTLPADPDANDGDAAAHGAGAGWWDMDWTWGSDAIPLQRAGFDVQVEPLRDGNYRVTMTPANPAAELAFLPGTNGPIACGESVTLAVNYDPGAGAPPLRGYEITFDASAEVSFVEGDIADAGALSAIGLQYFDIVANLDGSFTVSAALLGPTAGLTTSADLFNVTFHGAGSGTADVEILSYKLRDLDNGQFSASTLDASIDVDCDAPAAPTLTAEPEFTQGLANTLYWSDESASGAVEYYIERAEDAGFTTGLAGSGWISALFHEFTGLSDDQIYHYRVMARDVVGNQSAWSSVEYSTQDDNDPASSVDALPTWQTALTFDVAYTATDQTSGVASVELFAQMDGGGFTSQGTFASSPISFTASGDGVWDFYTVATDNVGNVEVDPGTADASTTVDTTAPDGSFVINNDDTYTTSVGVTLNMAVTDLNGVVNMRFSNDGVSWGGWTAYAPTFGWALPGPDGVNTVYAEFHDTPGNVWQTSDDIILDTAPPGAGDNLGASTGHEEVVLVWDDPGDGDLALVEIYRGPWHDGSNVSAYPEYDDLAADTWPTRPADRDEAVTSAEWTLAGTAAPGDETFVDSYAPRGIYWYEVFVQDLAGNWGPPLGDNAYAANYWLGDTFSPFDGFVDGADITDLGTAFGTAEAGGAPYDNENDVGPTDDWSRLGIPLTDNVIDFEDLMIYAMNYSVVSPLPKQGEASRVAMLTWYQVDESTWALGLTEPCYDLKALTLRAELPEGVTASVEGSSMLDHQGAPAFLRNLDGLDVSLALMGYGASLSSDGELFRVSFSEPVSLDEVQVDARGSDNLQLAFELGCEQVDILPEVYQLARNYPNPFNPKTTIRFDLPEAQDVSLVIFDAQGRLVRTLLSEVRDAGFHSVDWNGTDDRGLRVSSGIYFCRIEAGPLQQTERMVLLK